MDEGPVKRKSNKTFLIVGGIIAAVLVLGGLAYFLFFSGSSEPTPVPTPTTSASSSASASNSSNGSSEACTALASAMTDQDLTTEISVRLQELSKNTSAQQNAAYFVGLEKQLQPIKQQYQQQCLSDVAAGTAPATYRTFVNAFDRAVSDGASIGGQIASTKTVTSAQSTTLNDDAAQLEQAASALPTTGASPAALAPSSSGTTSEGQVLAGSETTAPSSDPLEGQAYPTDAPTAAVDANPLVEGSESTATPDPSYTDQVLANRDNALDEARPPSGTSTRYK
ncbi:MAG: hypothetical protein QG671_3570 [Actinomycetota bacterium]|nr:hypothetical protein [Actinomycetota bacterium]